MQKYDDDFVPYKKKSTKTPPAKAKHKHDFLPCVFEFNVPHYNAERGWVPELAVDIGSYCSICGKIGKADPNRWGRYFGVPMNSFYLHGRTEEAKAELDPKTRTLPTFWVKDHLKQKTVDPKTMKMPDQLQK